MGQGIYKHKLRKTKVDEFLGRRPKDDPEYKRIWRYLFGSRRGDLRKQRQRHRNHTGIPSIARQYCVFCVKEGLIWT